MAQFLVDFIDYFGLTNLIDTSTNITVQNFLGLTIIAFIGCLFSIMGVRCIFELIKIVTDWSRFR